MENTLKQIDLFMTSLESKKYLKSNINAFENVYGKINKHIQQKNDNEDMEAYEIKEFLKTIDFLKYCIIYEQIPFAFSSFCKAWCNLLHNWNNNVDQDKLIETDTLFIIRALDQHTTINESINILRGLISKAQSIQSWQAPGFEISQHLIDFLE